MSQRPIATHLVEGMTRGHRAVSVGVAGYRVAGRI